MYCVVKQLSASLRTPSKASSVHWVFLVKLLIVLTMLTSLPINAHEGRPVFIELNEIVLGDNSGLDYQLRWKIPPVLADGQVPVISFTVDDCHQFDAGSKSLNTRAQKSAMRLNATGLIGVKRYSCDVIPSEAFVSIEYPGANPALSSLIVITNGQGERRHIFSPPEQSEILISGKMSVLDVALQYLLGGVTHILVGWDHLLFVLCLLLIAGSLSRIILAITGFTVAHTITLILASLELVLLPSFYVEALIALSIAILAAEIMSVRRRLPPTTVLFAKHSVQDSMKLSLSWKFPILVSVGFGFVHGFGFASVLADLGLPQDMRLTALLLFNLGVELGQILFISVVILIAMVYAKLVSKRYQALTINLGVYSVGVIASYWIIQRLVEGLS